VAQVCRVQWSLRGLRPASGPDAGPGTTPAPRCAARGPSPIPSRRPKPGRPSSPARAPPPSFRAARSLHAPRRAQHLQKRTARMRAVRRVERTSAWPRKVVRLLLVARKGFSTRAELAFSILRAIPARPEDEAKSSWNCSCFFLLRKRHCGTGVAYQLPYGKGPPAMGGLTEHDRGLRGDGHPRRLLPV